MRPDILFENFEMLADAPNGVPKLREMILQLAVQGKLVPQDPNDEPASVTIKKIIELRCQSIEEKKIKKGKILQPIDPEEITHKIPETWIWTRLGEIVNYAGANKVSPDSIP